MVEITEPDTRSIANNVLLQEAMAAIKERDELRESLELAKKWLEEHHSILDDESYHKLKSIVG